MLSESNIIARLKSDFPEYIGDDAAVIEQSKEQSYVVTKDLLIEDVHFRTSYFDPLSLAHKALHVNLSDIAAMGAKPSFVLLGVSIPTSKQKYVEEFLGSFVSVCKESSVVLVGGDTTRSPDKIFISVTAIGFSQSKHIKCRSTARVGDLICVAGDLGLAHLGFIASEKSLSDFDDYKKIFLRPTAKVNEGLWLGSQSCVTSLMDISDGLFIDLRQLCQSSELQGRVELERFELSERFKDACKYLKVDPVETMITGGEDYSLLFTVDVDSYTGLAEYFLKEFGYAIKNIGLVTKGSGVNYFLNGERKTLTLKPFSHFGESI